MKSLNSHHNLCEFTTFPILPLDLLSHCTSYTLVPANFKHLGKSECIALSTDAHLALGSPSGRAGAKRLRGLTAPILPTSYPQIYCTDSLYETAFLHELSAHPSPPPFGRYLSRRERQEPGANLKQNDKPKFILPSTDAHRTLVSPTIHRHPPHPWLSLRESWREAPERAHCTDSTKNTIHRTTAPILHTTRHPTTHGFHDPFPPPFGRHLSPRGEGRSL